MYKYGLMALGLWACTFMTGQAQRLCDPEVVHGHLDNGLTYYLRRNPAGGPQASWYLIRNMGAVVEAPEERGLAHFLEHMAFQGTTHFPGKALPETLSRHGLHLGRDVNALTELDQTVYHLSHVPTRDPALADTCLLILYDWACGLSLEPQALAHEREVIEEEWRTGSTAPARMQQQTSPVIFAGSAYAGRDVIGDMEVIRTFPPARLQDFYRRWYRPDLTALAVVGDIDPVQLEARIRDLFDHWEAPIAAPPRTFVDIPRVSAPQYVQATDPEVQQATVSLYIRHAEPHLFACSAQEAVRAEVETMVFNGLAQARLRRWAQNPRRPFRSASVGVKPLVRGYGVYELLAVTRPGEEEEAWKALLLENEHLVREGFGPAELDRAKQALRSQLAHIRQDGATLDNETHIRSIQDHFLTGKPLLAFEDYAAAVEKVLDSLTPQALLDRIRRWNAPHNRTVVVTGPQDPEGSPVGGLSRERALALLARVAELPNLPPLASGSEPVAATGSASAMKSATASLLDSLPAPGRIISERTLPALEAVEWTLANGLQVVYRLHSTEREALRFFSVHEGGTAAYDEAWRPAAENVAMLSSFGAGDHEPEALHRLIGDKQVLCTQYIEEYRAVMEAAAPVREGELLFQVLHLRLRAPRIDSVLHARTLAHNRAALARRVPPRPEDRMADTVRSVCGTVPLLPFDATYLDRLTLDRLAQVYQARFCCPARTRVFLSGGGEVAQVRTWVERYLGSLPAAPAARVEDPSVTCASVQRLVPLPMTTPKATVFLQWSQALDFTPEHLLCHRVLREVLWSRASRALRDRAAGTYEVGVGATESLRPSARMALDLSFDCDPARAQELTALVRAEIRQLEEAPVEEEELRQARLRAARDLAPALLAPASPSAPIATREKESDAAWLQRAMDTFREGWDRTDARQYQEIWDRLDPALLRSYAQAFFRHCRIIDLLFVPKK